MASDPSKFEPVNVADTCAIWNVLSSQLLYSVARSAGCTFCCTRFVHYECLHKPRKDPKPEDRELQARLRDQCERGNISVHPLEIGDLQDVMVIENRKRLSKGELSSIAFARKIRRAFLTDDQGARKLAAEVIERENVQTTSHLFGWLIFNGRLGDSDKTKVIQEHKRFGRPLAPHFEDIYLTALKYRLMANSPIETATSAQLDDGPEHLKTYDETTGDDAI